MHHSQDNIILAYKQRFYDIRKEMELLRKELEEERYKLQRDKKILALEEERDWYRDELAKHEERYSKLEQSYAKLKSEHDELIADKELLREQLFYTKKENKALFLEKSRKNIQSASIQEPQTIMLSKTLKTAEHSMEKAFKINSPSTVNPFRSDQKSFHSASSPKSQIHVEQTNFSEEMQSSAKNTIESLRKQLENEKRKVQSLILEKPKQKFDDYDLKNLFMSCVEEVRKDVANRGKIECEKVKLNSFLQADKRKVMEIIFENEEFLQGIIDIMFPKFKGEKGKTLLTEFLQKAQEQKKAKPLTDVMRIAKFKGKQIKRRLLTVYKSSQSKPLTYV